MLTSVSTAAILENPATARDIDPAVEQASDKQTWQPLKRIWCAAVLVLFPTALLCPVRAQRMRVRIQAGREYEGGKEGKTHTPGQTETGSVHIHSNAKDKHAGLE